MPTKRISLEIEAYEKLKRARRSPDESFSSVVLRATWPEETVTGDALLTRYRRRGPTFSEDGIFRIEEMKITDLSPESKWRET